MNGGLLIDVWVLAWAKPIGLIYGGYYFMEDLFREVLLYFGTLAPERPKMLESHHKILEFEGGVQSAHRTNTTI